MNYTSIRYNVKIIDISKRDVSYHFKRNKCNYILFLICIILSVIISLVLVFESDNYLNLLTSNNKILSLLINGKSKSFSLFFGVLFKYFMPCVIMFLLCLNFYLSKICYLFFMYQFSLFVMTISAVLSMYGLAGVIKSLALIIPVNLLFFADLIFFTVVCMERVELADRTKYFKDGFDRFFFLKLLCSLIVLILIAIIIAFVYPLLIKSSIFYIF